MCWELSCKETKPDEKQLNKHPLALVGAPSDAQHNPSGGMGTQSILLPLASQSYAAAHYSTIFQGLLSNGPEVSSLQTSNNSSSKRPFTFLGHHAPVWCVLATNPTVLRRRRRAAHQLSFQWKEPPTLAKGCNCFWRTPPTFIPLRPSLWKSEGTKTPVFSKGVLSILYI